VCKPSILQALKELLLEVLQVFALHVKYLFAIGDSKRHA
jgi:hypothetical protein